MNYENALKMLEDIRYNLKEGKKENIEFIGHIVNDLEQEIINPDSLNIYNFIGKSLLESYKKDNLNWKDDMPYGDRPFDMVGLTSNDILNIWDFNVGVEMGCQDEPPFAIVLLTNNKLMIISTSLSLPPTHKVLGKDGWVYGNDLTKAQLKKFKF